MSTRTRVSRAALIVLALAGIGLAGCARNQAQTKADRAYVATDVETLYNVAKDRLDRRQYKQAGAVFDEVERQHPYSVWARRAQLMSAFSYYMGREYEQAILSAQRFLAVHPGNRDAPYAYYIVALSRYEQIISVDRDQKVTQEALDALNEIVRRYPNSRYAADARLKIDLARDHLAGREMEIGRFYQSNGNWLAAVGRFRRVITEYDGTSHVPEALQRLTESYLALGIPEEAKKAAAVLGYNYPGSKWYERAYALVKKHGAA
jgi:outer membrane protein assembly factor BamD